MKRTSEKRKADILLEYGWIPDSKSTSIFSTTYALWLMPELACRSKPIPHSEWLSLEAAWERHNEEHNPFYELGNLVEEACK